MRRASSEMMLATEDQEGGRPRDRETSSASNSPDSHRSRRRPRRLQGDDGTDPSSPPCLLSVPPSSPNDRTPSPSKEEAPFTRPKSWSSWSLHELPHSERMLRDAPRTLYLTPAHAPKAKKSSSASVPPPSPHRRPHPLDALDSRERIEVLRSGGHAYSVSRNKAFHLDISSSASTSVLLSTVMAVANEKARAAAASASAAASPPAAAARPPVPTGIPLTAIRQPSLEEAERDKGE
ncbi:unnamed protein product [Cyprideis torosa]|uniref:Uncharacterized protein n=1 Tax=Cyprideis torosa TaxID=163714 RepID=A0A7R8ZXZ4_9CRUS|nr:unnamed protein product [Cyprideis torosa]CAG0907835.1 unnamed protein product [Cyprideis torosa]